MIIQNVTLPILRNRVENHSEVKESILKAIGDMPNLEIYEDTSSIISKTDWKLSSEYSRPYWNIVGPIVEETVIREMFKLFKCDNIEITAYWYQQYLKTGVHEWHNHPKTHWTNIYYVELPSEEVKTELVDVTRNERIQFDAKEGDIVSFPGMLFHRSPTNMSDKRKTIMSFNIDILP